MRESEGSMRILDHQYTVREAIPADVPRIAEIWLEGVGTVFGGDGSSVGDLEGIHAQLLKLVNQQTTNFKFWLCEDRSQTIIGWSTVQPFHTTPHERVRNAYGFISTYMSKQLQSRGVGLKLLQFVIDYCKTDTNIRFVFGLQDRSNIPSVTIGDRVGFQDYGQLPSMDDLPLFSVIVCPTPKRISNE